MRRFGRRPSRRARAEPKPRRATRGAPEAAPLLQRPRRALLGHLEVVHVVLLLAIGLVLDAREAHRQPVALLHGLLHLRDGGPRGVSRGDRGGPRNSPRVVDGAAACGGRRTGGRPIGGWRARPPQWSGQPRTRARIARASCPPQGPPCAMAYRSHNFNVWHLLAEPTFRATLSMVEATEMAELAKLEEEQRAQLAARRRRPLQRPFGRLPGRARRTRACVTGFYNMVWSRRRSATRRRRRPSA